MDLIEVRSDEFKFMNSITDNNKFIDDDEEEKIIRILFCDDEPFNYQSFKNIISRI